MDIVFGGILGVIIFVVFMAVFVFLPIKLVAGMIHKSQAKYMIAVAEAQAQAQHEADVKTKLNIK